MGPGLPHVTRVLACPVSREPWPAPCHWSGGLTHAVGHQPARRRKGWRGRPFPPPSLSTAGSTARGREYNVENQKCTTVTTVPASLIDPSLAEAEESVHFLPPEPRLLQTFTGKPEGKGVAVAPVPAPPGPCGGQQVWATSPPAPSARDMALPPGRLRPSLPALEHAASHCLQSDRQVSENRVILMPKRHLLSDTCF